jgi:tight adherence protein B
MGIVGSVLMLVGAGSIVIHALRRSRIDGQLATLLPPTRPVPVAPPPAHPRVTLSFGAGRRRSSVRWVSGAMGACVGLLLGGVPAGIVGLLSGVIGSRLVDRRQRVRESQKLERQLGDLVEACALAVRGGASVSQAVVIGSQEVDEPMRSIAVRMVEQQRLGSTFDEALHGFAHTLGSEDARLFALVTTIHHRTGGTVTGPLDHVASTIRHRFAVRRELRALTAQGRMSGAVLGVLPVAFFLVLNLTSRSELLPVYRSTAGASMIVGGFVLEGLAYLWIRHLLKVET